MADDNTIYDFNQKIGSEQSGYTISIFFFLSLFIAFLFSISVYRLKVSSESDNLGLNDRMSLADLQSFSKN